MFYFIEKLIKIQVRSRLLKSFACNILSLKMPFFPFLLLKKKTILILKKTEILDYLKTNGGGRQQKKKMK